MKKILIESFRSLNLQEFLESHLSADMSGEVELSRERICELIEGYRNKPVLWDTSRPDYKDRVKKSLAWNDLSEEFGLETAVLQRKIQNLRCQWAAEKNKVERSIRSGASSTSVYKPKWFGYTLLNFLNDSMSVRQTRTSMVSLRNTLSSHELQLHIFVLTKN